MVPKAGKATKAQYVTWALENAERVNEQLVSTVALDCNDNKECALKIGGEFVTDFWSYEQMYYYLSGMLILPRAHDLDKQLAKR